MGNTLLGAIDITPDRPAPQPDITDETRYGKPQAAGTTAGNGEDSLASFNL